MGRATEYIIFINDTAISDKDNRMVYLSCDNTIIRQRYEYQKNLKKKKVDELMVSSDDK